MIFDCSATTCLQYTNIRNNLKVKVNKPAQRNHNMEEHTNFLVHYDDTQKLFFIEKKHVLHIQIKVYHNSKNYGAPKLDQSNWSIFTIYWFSRTQKIPTDWFTPITNITKIV